MEHRIQIEDMQYIYDQLGDALENHGKDDHEGVRLALVDLQHQVRSLLGAMERAAEAAKTVEEKSTWDQSQYDYALRIEDKWGERDPGSVRCEGVLYYDELSGPGGAHFFLFRETETTEEDIRKAKNRLRGSRDVTGFTIIDARYLYGRKEK